MPYRFEHVKKAREGAFHSSESEGNPRPCLSDRAGEITWSDFLAMVEDRTRQRRVLAGQIGAFRQVLKLRDMYPESRTPGEACMRAGVDPRSFKIEVKFG